MAANVYSTTFYSGLPTSGFHSIYTVPAGFVALIKEIRAFIGSPYYTNVQGIYLAKFSTGVVFYSLQVRDVMPQVQYVSDCHVVLQPGEQIGCGCPPGESSSWHLWVSGYQLTLP